MEVDQEKNSGARTGEVLKHLRKEQRGITHNKEDTRTSKDGSKYVKRDLPGKELTSLDHGKGRQSHTISVDQLSVDTPEMARAVLRLMWLPIRCDHSI
ncbi:hypothetical protein U1Q18_019874 [Sarracenia purpurea var. burkii]